MIKRYFRDLYTKLDAVERSYGEWESQNTESRIAWFKPDGSLLHVFGQRYNWWDGDPEPPEFYDWGEEVTSDHRILRPKRRRSLR